jgi:hypothetical protein
VWLWCCSRRCDSRGSRGSRERLGLADEGDGAFRTVGSEEILAQCGIAEETADTSEDLEVLSDVDGDEEEEEGRLAQRLARLVYTE